MRHSEMMKVIAETIESSLKDDKIVRGMITRSVNEIEEAKA